MRNLTNTLLSTCTGEQLFLLAIAQAGLRPAVGRVLDSRARVGQRRSVVQRLPNAAPAQGGLVLRRAG